MDKRKGNVIAGLLMVFALICSCIQVGIQIYLFGYQNASAKIYAEAANLGYAKQIKTSSGSSYSWVIPASTTAELK